ncbi:MAG TPA: ABC-2 family transporter protein [Herpetosiphonaceae bacterium]
MRRYWRIYRVLLRREMNLVIVYRAQMIIWLLTGVLPLIMLAAWLSLGEGGPVGSFTPTDFIAYYLAAIFVRQLTGVWIVWDMDYQIRQGEFSTMLLRPLDPIHHWAARGLGSKGLRLVLLLPTLGTAALLTGVRYDLHPSTLLAFLAAMFGAWLLSFLIQYINGLLAFWITQAVAVFDLWFGLWTILSGYLIPLDLLPAAVGQAAYWLPFRYQLAVPLEILMGRLHGVELWRSLGLQALWILAMYALTRLLWRRGIKKYSAVGA